MTKVTTTVDVSSFTTDAKFRTWGSAASTALQACGLVMTSDTGQINWSTVTKPTTTAVKAGYEIYRFNDTLQATKPIYIRFDYGSGNVASGNVPSTWITVGTGSNGAGTITGITLGPIQSGYSGTSGPNGTAMAMYFTHSTANGYLLAHFGRGQSSSNSALGPGIYIVERTKDSSGASTGTGLGLTLSALSTTFGLSDYSMSFDSLAAYSTARSLHCGMLSTAISMGTANAVATYRHWIWTGSLNPAVGRLTYFLGDFADGVTFSAAPWGSTAHTYQVFSGYTTADMGANSNACLSYLWED